MRIEASEQKIFCDICDQSLGEDAIEGDICEHCNWDLGEDEEERADL